MKDGNHILCAKPWELRREVEKLQTEIDCLRTDFEELKEEINRLRSVLAEYSVTGRMPL